MATKDVAKNVPESFSETAHAFAWATGAKASTAHVGVHACVAVLVVGGAFLRVRQHLVSLFGLFEFIFGFFGIVTLVAIRVVFHGQLAVGLFDVFLGGVFCDAQNFVIVALGHELTDNIENERMSYSVQLAPPPHPNPLPRVRWRGSRNAPSPTCGRGLG